MCLYKGTNKHKVAGKDKTCYKLVIVDISKKKKQIRSLYREKLIHIGKPIKRRYDISVNACDFALTLGGSVVHAYRGRRFSKAFIEIEKTACNLWHKNVYKLGLLECIIPAGTIYYENITDSNCNDYPGYYHQYGAFEIMPVKLLKIF